MARSVEEQVEDWVKEHLKKGKVKLFSKTQPINPEISEALKEAPSKRGGEGPNYPDIQVLSQLPNGKFIPVMIEIKGLKGKLERLNDDGSIANSKKNGEPNYTNINGWAANGAVHYGNAIIDNCPSYDSVIAIGVNDYESNIQLETWTEPEVSAWFISTSNMRMPKKLVSFDWSLLFPNNAKQLKVILDDLALTSEEREAVSLSRENMMEINLKRLNQMMHEDLNISTNARVTLITGMIMAGLSVVEHNQDGTLNVVLPELEIADLKGGALDTNGSDGNVIVGHIEDFLSHKQLPKGKHALIVRSLKDVFLNSALERPIDGESKLKTLYREVKTNIVPFVDPEKSGYLDFTGKLFNTLTEWVDIPDGGENDVVLTPRYVTNMMAKLCNVSKDDFVWDYALGTAGFLVSAMRLMLEDADRIIDVGKREQVKRDIRANQLIGIEKRPDIYMLAVLNMILMGDGTAHILQDDSLKWDGAYPDVFEIDEKGNSAPVPFPATVFLLNPPYSAPGKGFNFVELALSRMGRGGRAAVLIQENAGCGNGNPFTERILKHSTLKASIHMANIFHGKTGVQTAIYVFETGIPHDPNKEVLFIDMGEDGYTRQNRKKASAATNLRDTDHAKERYAEVVDIVLGRKKQTDYYQEGEHVFKDTITLSGNDWTVNQHKKYDTVPTEDDFRKTVSDYLAWKVAALLTGEIELDVAAGKRRKL